MRIMTKDTVFFSPALGNNECEFVPFGAERENWDCKADKKRI